MALDAISNLRFDIADREAKGIRESQNIAGIPTGALAGVGGAVNQGLDKLKNIKTLEADSQAKQQQKELLDKGVGGVMEYATELGLDPAKYQRLGAHAKDQNGFINLYAMVKKEKESKDKKDALGIRSGEQTQLSERLNSLSGIENRDTFESTNNELAKLVSTFSTPESKTEGFKTLKAFQEQDAAKSARSSAGKSEVERRLNITRPEKKMFDSETKGYLKIEEAKINIETAVQQMVETANSENPSFVVLDNVIGVAFQKLLDPISVVRESEFNRLGAGQGFIQNLLGQWEKSTKGGLGFTSNTRVHIVDFMQKIARMRDLMFLEGTALTYYNRSNGGKDYDLGEINADRFNAENMEKLRKIKSGEIGSELAQLRKDIKASVNKFKTDPKMFTGGDIEDREIGRQNIAKGSATISDEAFTASEKIPETPIPTTIISDDADLEDF